ncbi:MAG TPA: MarR family transcriptional regulator [Ktedonobacterales bacterium]|nr:MarR family transcriptional regulator [Ktedonobacterales bacterium]
MADDNAATYRDITDQLAESTGFLLAELGQESRHRFMAHVNRQELGWPHQSVLSALLDLAQAGATSQKQLGEFAHVDPRNLVAILDALEARALVERVPVPADRRRSGIRLTDGGARLARELRATGAALERDFLAALNQAEQDTLHQLLVKLYRGISDGQAGA